MRRSGLVHHARGLGSHDHVCWSFERPDEFRLRAREFLADGLRLGALVWYVAAGDAAELAGHLGELDGWADALRDGRARVVSVEEVYPAGHSVDPEAQVRVYAEATEAALAAGYTGLRIAADATSLVRTPAQLAAFARYEWLVDRYMATRPFSAMCAYHSAELPESTLTQLACQHPNANAAFGFRLFGAAAHSAALGGELDTLSRTLFPTVLRQAAPAPEDGRLTIDATNLRFLDHHSLLRLAEYAAARDARLVLRTGWPGAARLVDVLEMDVQVEEVA
ncbi:MEDS domain-containing protein [Nocardia sp. NPDC004068]|uniref:MEDS domain-containing protein n=1 Tax=Nocardia sp. NPDC004068 TaxID=3364303 RepID=UPI003692A4AB